MNVVITMAGLGSRFRRAGYDLPKYQIEARGKTLFEWSMRSLEDFWGDGRFFFVVRREDGAGAFIARECEKLGVKRYRVIELQEATCGQAQTALLAAPFWDENDGLLIYNIDTYVEPGEMTARSMRGDGFLPCFHAAGDHWSFVRTDETGRAREVREKKRISDNCTVGAYYFKSGGLYARLYRDFYAGGRTQAGEQYVAPLYNRLIEEGGAVYISVIERNKVHVLGTPEELRTFIDGAG